MERLETLHVELVERTRGVLELRMWRDNPNLVRTRALEPAEVEGLTRMAEEEYYTPRPARIRELGGTLFRWLDGAGRELSSEIAASASRADVLILAVAAPLGLAHLPWEALHDGGEYLLHALNPPVLPVRWHPAAPVPREPANRPLQALFMACSPRDETTLLDFEEEESQILQATRSWPMDLVVEESGSLEGLSTRLHGYGTDHVDVLHLTGHATHEADGTPVFLMEDGEGWRVPATAPQLARSIPYRPPLVFLSGCRTGERPAAGELLSFAEQMVARGFAAVLGWGRPVRDSDAILAARSLYEHLAAGVSLPLTLVRVHARLRGAGVENWHLLRLFCAGDPTYALVTPLRTPDRPRRAPRPVQSEFLDPDRLVRVASRAEFRGRRRLLQETLGLLRQPETDRVGVLLHGPAGVGKSSLAARAGDRLRDQFQLVVVAGRLDEASLVRAWAAGLSPRVANGLRAGDGGLARRIETALLVLAGEGAPAPLFVLDALEQNQPSAGSGDPTVAPHAAPTLGALLEALGRTGLGRVLVTSRSPLPEPYGRYLETLPVPPLRAGR